LPWYQNAGFTILYNTDMWTKAGFEAGPAITWAEFAQQLYVIKEKGVIAHPFVLSGMQDFDSTWAFDNIVKGHGGYWFETWQDPKDIQPAFTSNEHNLEAAAWIEKLIKDEVVHPASLNFEADGANDLFIGGDTATILQFDYSAAEALDPAVSKIVDQVGCAVMPGSDGQHSGGSFVDGYGYFIYTPAKERDLEAVVAVYEILAGPWANTVWAEKAALGPAYKSIQDDPRVLKGMPFMPVWSEQSKYSVVRQTNPQWEKPFAGLGILTEWQTNREAYLSAFYTGSMDAKTMWQKLEEDYLRLEERAIKEGREHTG
jgi:ABC-type glycerol-3-phosphate transport system substrate-binding protein